MIKKAAKAMYEHEPYTDIFDGTIWWGKLDKYSKAFFLEKARVALEAADVVRPSGWQPIETAPKDGTEIIITNGCDTCTGKYHKSVVQNYTPFFAQSVNGELRNEGFDYRIEPVYFYKPAYWQPLPEPPK